MVNPGPAHKIPDSPDPMGGQFRAAEVVRVTLAVEDRH
jgi:hypothetical protein